MSSNLMERALEVLNELVESRVIGTYAIGGAMGAAFYTEPILTFDLDVFVVLDRSPGGILTVTPIYDVLRSRGYEPQADYIVIESVPVQFLPAYNRLVEEALEQAVDTSLGATKTRVFRPEHLIAIALQTGRAKDKERVLKLNSQAPLDEVYLTKILKSHNLERKWIQWTN
jgi:hypothetical protein